MKGKYGLRIIRAMSLEEVRDLREVSGWGRSDHGKVGHLWPERRRTICDRRLVPGGHHWYYRAKCAKCERRLLAVTRRERRLRAEAEEVRDG